MIFLLRLYLFTVFLDFFLLFEVIGANLSDFKEVFHDLQTMKYH